MKSYIEQKINDLRKVSDPEAYIRRLSYNDKELEKKWKCEQSNNYTYIQTIKTNDDVIDLIDRFDGQVSFVENYVPYGAGITEDGYKMALAEYRALQGLQKMAQFVDAGRVGGVEFAPLSETEIDDLFERMKGIIHRKNRQNERRGYEDRR